MLLTIYTTLVINFGKLTRKLREVKGSYLDTPISTQDETYESVL